VDSPEVAERIEVFVRNQFSVGPSDPGFGRDADLLDGGYVDSVGFVELLEFLGEEFGVEVPDDDLLSDEFSSIDGMARIISRLAGAKS
jgi:D-alanine--poly(phosphoribitol) ligase subunit 2